MGIKCKICKEETKYNNYSNFTSHHLKKQHIDYTTKKYFDLFLKEENEDICEECGIPKTFLSISRRYTKYCSNNSCRNKQSDINIKKKKTCLDRYNNENYRNSQKSLNTLIQNGTNISRTVRAMKTKRNKYGDETYNNKEKHKETCIIKYNTTSHFNDNNIKEKIKKTFKNKYGVNFPLQNEHIHKKTIQKNIENRLNDIKEFIYKNDCTIEKIDNDIFDLCCDKNHKFSISRQMIRIRNKNKEVLCNVCNPYIKDVSKSEIELLDFVKENYNGIVFENDRNLLNGKELDIYLPNLNLAFEFNGLYWHSELYKSKDYHLNKTETCLKFGVKLIHIYEDDWLYKKDIVKSRILNLLGKSKTIYARKCIIEEVDKNIANSFLKENHIQGKVNSKYNIGLYYDNELVSIMTFGNARFEKNKTELLRFCNKLYTNIIGGASRLFKYFINTYKTNEIISYADRSWSNGNIYKKLNFSYVYETKPNYYYIINNNRENRFKYRKEQLIKEGYNKDKTEKDIMFERGIYRIYDSGNLKYCFKK